MTDQPRVWTVQYTEPDEYDDYESHQIIGVFTTHANAKKFVDAPGSPPRYQIRITDRELDPYLDKIDKAAR